MVSSSELHLFQRVYGKSKKENYSISTEKQTNHLVVEVPPLGLGNFQKGQSRRNSLDKAAG